ncbi:Glycine cleavage system transcriptional activator [Sulfitobacter sp. DSM 110093]|nr:Glycine cleavage system transcriptional activator [Sulfitobacter sp. DSM 110093]
MANPSDHAHFLRHLVVFSTACRAENFSRAAEELGVSRVAVSRQIADLEAHLDTPLFERGHRTVHATAAGLALDSVITPALVDVTEALDRLRSPDGIRRLKVTVTSAFANYWLMPRLAEFSEQRPDIEIDLAVSDRYLNLEAEAIDLAIRYAPEEPPGARFMTQESILPVWSPDYPAQTALETPKDLLSERLMHLSGLYRPEAKWENWFSVRGMELPADPQGLQFNSYFTMLQAALEGHGVALAGNPLVERFLADGRLKRMNGVSPLARDTYWLVVRTDERPETAAFADWIMRHFSTGATQAADTHLALAPQGDRAL